MIKGLRFALGLIIILAVISMVLPVVYSQEEEAELITPAEEELMTISGEIVSVDLEKSNIVIKYIDDYTTGSLKELTISVNAATNIEREYTALAISDLKAQDAVLVEYAVDANGNNIAKNILVGIATEIEPATEPEAAIETTTQTATEAATGATTGATIK
ncbi:MAG: hypothetical protein FJZ11_02945 [Candidatus Omnitrophica bacterium]|nr:hypothetical protein [Candidatus Omnitrophota bacterium]